MTTKRKPHRPYKPGEQMKIAMSTKQYLAALKALELTTNRMAAEATGLSIRQHQRIAHGEADVPETVAKLLRLALEVEGLAGAELASL